MDDLISRSALLAAYDKAHKGPPGGARKLIEEAPAVVVRCKYCKHRPDPHETELNGEMHRYCELHRRWTTDNWFCADGER